MTNKDKKRVHLINLFRWRSIVALIACLITLIFSLGAIGFSLQYQTLQDIRKLFRWFTTDSNLLTGLSAILIIPYAIEGISKKRLTYPKWLQRIHYAGTNCLMLVMAFTILFISRYDRQMAFGRANFFLHIICPIMITISFFMTESNYPLDRKDNLIALIPILCYACVYLFNVIITQRWPDMYMLNAYIPFYVSAVLMFLLAYILGWLIRILYNRLRSFRDRKLKLIWKEELDPVTIRIELYSLGYHAGLYEDKENISVPFDILEDVADRFDLKLDDLARAYLKGVIEGIREKETHK